MHLSPHISNKLRMVPLFMQSSHSLQHSYTQSPDSMNSERKSGEKRMASGQRVIRSFNEQVIAKNLCIKFAQMSGQGKSCCCPSTAPRQNIIDFQIVHKVCCLPSLKIP
jgi:hypothetical protein